MCKRKMSSCSISHTWKKPPRFHYMDVLSPMNLSKGLSSKFQQAAGIKIISMTCLSLTGTTRFLKNKQKTNKTTCADSGKSMQYLTILKQNILKG